VTYFESKLLRLSTIQVSFQNSYISFEITVAECLSERK